ncbi:MAG: hypothetical protein AB7P76_06735 [Candidatus Melainabacteria bacterium]
MTFKQQYAVTPAAGTQFTAAPSQPSQNNPETGWTQRGTSTGIRNGGALRFAGTPSWPQPGIETLSRTDDPYHAVQPFFGSRFRFPEASGHYPHGGRDPYRMDPTKAASEEARGKTITGRKEWIA